MFGLTLAEVLNLLSVWGYPLIFLLAVFEGPVVMMLAGAVASLGHFSPLLMFLVLVAADIVGDAVYYVVGRYSHGNVGGRLSRWIGITEEREKKIEQAFEKHGGKILLFTKTQAIGSVALYAAGAVRMPFWKFIWYNMLGTVPKAALLEAAGYSLGSSYEHFQTYLDYTAITTLLVAVAMVGLYFLLKRYAGEWVNLS